MHKTTLAAIWFITLTGLVLETTPILRAAEKPDQKTAKAVKKAPPSGQSHMIVTKDPVTGKLRQATADEAAALNQQVSDRAKRTPAAPRMIEGPGGAVGMILDDTSTNVPNTEASRKTAPAKAAKKATGNNNEK